MGTDGYKDRPPRMMSRLFLQVINWIGFVGTTVSQNLKVDYDPTPPFAEQKTKQNVQETSRGTH